MRPHSCMRGELYLGVLADRHFDHAECSGLCRCVVCYTRGLRMELFDVAHVRAALGHDEGVAQGNRARRLQPVYDVDGASTVTPSGT